MPIPLCGECYLSGYCRRLKARVVTDDDLTPRFVADVRVHMRSLGFTRDDWKPFLIDAYRNYPGQIVDATDREVMLDTSVFDQASIRYWFRDLCRPIPVGALPRLRRGAKPRFCVMASMLRAIYPVPAMLWGKKIANDREPALPKPSSTADRCPYTDPARVSVLIFKRGKLGNIREYLTIFLFVWLDEDRIPTDASASPRPHPAGLFVSIPPFGAAARRIGTIPFNLIMTRAGPVLCGRKAVPPCSPISISSATTLPRSAWAKKPRQT